MTSRFNPLALKLSFGQSATAPAPLISTPLALIGRTLDGATMPVPRRTKIWELSRHLHCSIIGTCLSTVELRHILIKAGLAGTCATDHELHGQGVLLAGQRDAGAKLLHKALDRRHRQVINQFEKAKIEDEVAALWRDAVKRGEIPGAYWAVLTHAATTAGLVRIVFGEVHMLSHLVGAANRADIRRLSALEAENVELQEKLRRQQEQLRDGLSSRDAKIRDLGLLLARKLADESEGQTANAKSDQATLTKLVADLERRLSSESRRRGSFEARVIRLTEQLQEEHAQRKAAEYKEAALREELQVVEASLIASEGDAADGSTARAHLDGLSLLYVGGRPNQLSRLRALTEQFGASFLYHDGGIEDRSGLLAGLVSRANVVMFPVDCVSHDAVAAVKRLCRQASKPFVPLRSGGISSFVVALSRVDVAEFRTVASTMTAS